MKIAFFGSSLVSCYWNGAATYYRGILNGLAALGHAITFYEPDALGRQRHRDIDDPAYAQVVVYPATADGWQQAVREAQAAEIVIKASGVGVFDSELEAAIAGLTSPRRVTVFWDVDAPATLERMKADRDDALRRQVPRFSLVLTYGGGQRVIEEYLQLGARQCIPVYNALDPSTHFPVRGGERFAADLSFLGNRLPDREQRVKDFLVTAALRLPQKKFLLAGAGWRQQEFPDNLRVIGHLGSGGHNDFNCSARAVLNVTRDSMVRFGYSPPTRIFEAAGAGACLICDAWPGIENFLQPGREVLIACNGEEVADHLAGLDDACARAIGQAARQRLLRDHTYNQRARQVDDIFKRAVWKKECAA